MRPASMVQHQPAFQLEPRGPFALAAAARFWSSFTPAGRSPADAQEHLHLTFPVEGSWAPVGICLVQDGGAIAGTVYGDADPELARRQTARILSLDVDGRAFADVGARDQVVAGLQRSHPGLRPVCFSSPYEAAAWAILSSRVQMRQAAAIKARLTAAFGEIVNLHGQTMPAFPAPRTIAGLDQLPGVPDAKLARLRAVAEAALAGLLDSTYLRSLSDADALARLRTIPGIGPFSAELILLRGAGHPDYLTLLEPRFRRAVGEAYGLPAAPTDADLLRIAESWRPYRTWVTFLLRQDAERRLRPAETDD